MLLKNCNKCKLNKKINYYYDDSAYVKKIVAMQILCRLVFAQSFLLMNLKLCSSKLYLKPDDDLGFDSRNSLDSNENNDLIIVVPNNLESTDELTGILNEALHKITNRDKSEESDESDLDSQVTDKWDLDTQETHQSDLDVEDFNLNNAQKDMLRKRWRSSCDKKASRTCASACKNTYKIVCSSYRCRRRMKKEFRKECKSNCKAKFRSSVSSDESD